MDDLSEEWVVDFRVRFQQLPYRITGFYPQKPEPSSQVPARRSQHVLELVSL
ncbi:hypothetical protein GA0115254_131556 [Streptomyces sp. Ncost-T10-10d]|nr:hypothetical protein GA0115254_131556 [Streptomyces sp. Ncost-T10-10d]